MKRILLFSVFIFCSFSGKTQSLGYLDLPVAGELWIEFKDTLASNLTISNSGAGQIWNYQNSFTVHDTLEFLPQLPSSVPANISTLFPQSNLVSEGQVAGDYTFIKTDFTGMYVDGLHSNAGFDIAGFNLTDLNYNNNLLVIPVPFQFGDVIQNTSTFEYVYPDNNLYQGALVRATYSTFQDLEMESQGELTTPLGNYTSVLRLREMMTKSILFEVDSFAIGNFYYFTDQSFPTTFAYKWFKNGPNCLVMTADLDEFNNVVSASYYSSGGIVSDKNGLIQNNVVIIPNPVKQGNSAAVMLNENYSNTVSVMDMSGREVFQNNVPKGIQSLNLNTTNLNSGLYLVKVLNKEGASNYSKLVVNN